MSGKYIKLTIQEIKIPFRVSFKHSSAKRSQTQTVIVTASDQNGLVGYGESCPREYVTGESIHSVYQFYEKHHINIESSIFDIDSLKQWLNLHESEIDASPAAWCAIELALLDLIAKQNHISIEVLLGLPVPANQYQYSAILGDNSEDVFAKQVQQYSEVGFFDYKIKLSGNLEKDKKKLTVLSRIGGESIRVRVDANNLWRSIDEAVAYVGALNYPLFAIEEPLISKDMYELAVLGDKLALPIILDESCINMTHLGQLAGAPEGRWILNVRVSKMGGLERALSFLKVALELRIPIIIGAQVGETSILTRAALTLASFVQDALIAQEGAFGTHLLIEDICSPSLMFGHAGILDLCDYQLDSQSGLGLAFSL